MHKTVLARLHIQAKCVKPNNTRAAEVNSVKYYFVNVVMAHEIAAELISPLLV